MQSEHWALNRLRQALQADAPPPLLDFREGGSDPPSARPRPTMAVVDRIDLSLEVYRLMRITG